MDLSYLRFYSCTGGLLWIMKQEKELSIPVTDANGIIQIKLRQGFLDTR